jgi:hypothetical protein
MPPICKIKAELAVDRMNVNNELKGICKEAVVA